tara:strand:+ start:6774 stop:8321 length:1548 start_codon:yes stop_codon:yes gene_type:complete
MPDLGQILKAQLERRKRQAIPTLENLMTGETGPMPNQPGPLASVDLTPVQNLISGREALGDERDQLLAERKRNLADTQAFLKRTERSDLGRADPDAYQKTAGILGRADEYDASDVIPVRPYWDSIESRMGKNIRNIVGDARADEMEMDLFGPAVTPGAATRSPTTQRKTSSEAVDVLSNINRRKNLLRAISSIWGTKDNSEAYETAALAKYDQQLTNRGLAQLTDADFASTRAFIQAGTRAGIPLKQLIELIKGGIINKESASKNEEIRNFVDGDGNPHVGILSWKNGQLTILDRKTRQPAPSDWTLKTSPMVQIGGEKPGTAVQKAMIERAGETMKEARGYWLTPDGKLREERTFANALAWTGPARTTRIKMENALSQALRLESGAAIGDDERAQFYELFMPKWNDWLSGDREAVIVDKFDRFEKYIKMIMDAINPITTKGKDGDALKRQAFMEALSKAEEEAESAKRQQDLIQEADQVDEMEVLRIVEAAEEAGLSVKEYLELQRLKREAGED